MCRNITREQQAAGWRALLELLSCLKPRWRAALGGLLVPRRDQI
ncbi:MAG: hypothetical protein AAF495_29080 [Pseudomonadota bacterium]